MAVIGISAFAPAAALQSAPARTAAGQAPGLDAASVKLMTIPQGVILSEGSGVMTCKGADPGRLADRGGPGTDDPKIATFVLDGTAPPPANRAAAQILRLSGE